MDNKTLEEFLQNKHFEETPHLLDDDLVDAYKAWIGNLDAQEILNFAEEFIAKKDQETKAIIEKMIGSDDCLEWNTNSEEVNGYSTKRNEIIEIAKKHKINIK